MADMRYTAQQLAAQGRFGDTMLIHVSPAEVAGIASLIPGGLTINPHTGLPEAFFFLPFLASLFGAAAPAAAAATTAATAAAAAAPALAAGAGTAAAAGTAATAAGTAATGLGGLGAGLSSVLHGIGSIPSAIGSFVSGGAGAAGAAAPTAGALMHGAAAVPTMAGHALTPTLAHAAAAPLTQTLTHSFAAGAPAVNIGGAAAAHNAALPLAAQPALTAPVTVAPAPSILTPPLSQAPTIGAATPAFPAHPAIASPSGTLASPAGQSYAGAGTATTGPAANATKVATAIREGAVDPWDKLRAVTPAASTEETTKTGIGGLLSMDNIMKAGIVAQMLGGLFKGKGKKEGKTKDYSHQQYTGGEPSFHSASYVPAIQGEHNYFPHSYFANPMANGGLVALASGGLVPGYADGGQIDLQAQKPQDMSFPLNGGSIGGNDQAPALAEIPSSPYPSAQIGAEPSARQSVDVPQEADKELIAATVDAILGKISDPQPVLLAFVKEFGEPALQDLVQRVQGLQQQGMARPGPDGGLGVGDGMSDSIPAMIDGQQPAALSEGEFVVPADAVSGLGNGSTQAGAKHLQSMVDGVRQQRTGRPQQPPQINAGYHVGGLVGYKKGGAVKLPKEAPAKRQDRLPADIQTYVVPDEPAFQFRGYPVEHVSREPLYVQPGRQSRNVEVLAKGQPANPDYVNESMMPEWADRYWPSPYGWAMTGNPFATQQDLNLAWERQLKEDRRSRVEAGMNKNVDIRRMTQSDVLNEYGYPPKPNRWWPAYADGGIVGLIGD